MQEDQPGAGCEINKQLGDLLGKKFQMLVMLYRKNLHDQVMFAIYLKNNNCSPNTILKFHAFFRRNDQGVLKKDR